MTQFLYHDQEHAIRELLIGRRIVSADMDSQTLKLDDGTDIRVVPNEGCGGCSAGWYELMALATVDNAITSVRVSSESLDGGDPYYEGNQSYKIFVIAENAETCVVRVEVEGDDGNGYYGTGFVLEVMPPEAQNDSA